jgi:hypothetical protein
VLELEVELPAAALLAVVRASPALTAAGDLVRSPGGYASLVGDRFPLPERPTARRNGNWDLHHEACPRRHR